MIAPVEQLLEDVQVDAGSREIARGMYEAALREGRSQDEAMAMAAAALHRMREHWEEAKEQDGERIRHTQKLT
jgi:broad specificity phosphatase PhoE